jgi:virulence factor Mce-like protein
MPNSLDLDGRGPTERQLLGLGVVVLVLALATIITMLLKSTGRLDNYVRVIADLHNVGDGLPARSDVKYHGLIVGSVDDVEPTADGGPNYVHIDLDTQYAKDIPATVSARVVPNNVFAVSTVQLVDRGTGGAAIANGTHIPENTELSTVIFQTTISKLRDVIAATARGRDDHSIGILAAVAAATDNRGEKLLTAGGQLSRLLDELNAIVTTDPGPSTLTALVKATQGLQSTAPDLVDALHQAVVPMQTFAEKRAELNTLLTGALHTAGLTNQALVNHTDQLIHITHDLTPVFGVLAQHSDTFVPIFSRVNRLSDKFFENFWDPEFDTGNLRLNMSFTPTYTYTRADCPRYGQLAGPSCATAPKISVRPDLPAVLLPQNYQPPNDLAPPPGTVVGPDGNLVATGAPLLNPNPDLSNPDPALPWWTGPAPRVPGTANPDDIPPPPPSTTAPPALPAEVAPAGYGGTVGPVGSQQERGQLGLLTGHASVANQLLLGPLARGMTVSADNDPAQEPK